MDDKLKRVGQSMEDGMNDKIKQFPNRMLGTRAQPATLDSELDPANPFETSLIALLKKRAALIIKYSPGDGSVHEVEREIAERLTELAGF